MAGPRILITGCSGGGKSALLRELSRRGHATVAGPGRRVIAAERARGGDGLPWENPRAFAEACLALAERDWQGARAGPVFYDRGVPDAVFALRRLGDQSTGQATLTGCRYDRVFLAPPWQALFDAAQDPDRRHGFAEAVAEYEDIAAGLAGRGERFEILPAVGIAARADWVEARLATG